MWYGAGFLSNKITFDRLIRLDWGHMLSNGHWDATDWSSPEAKKNSHEISELTGLRDLAYISPVVSLVKYRLHHATSVPWYSPAKALQKSCVFTSELSQFWPSPAWSWAESNSLSAKPREWTGQRWRASQEMVIFEELTPLALDWIWYGRLACKPRPAVDPPHLLPSVHTGSKRSCLKATDGCMLIADWEE